MQRSAKDNADIRTFRVRSSNDIAARRPKRGNGVCQNPECGKLDTRGLTRSAASGFLLCHSCISSSVVRDRLAAEAKKETK